MSMEINCSVTSQVMGLKTSTPGVTRKEEIKTGSKNVDDYSYDRVSGIKFHIIK